MSVIQLTKWGNSVGVRIPASELKIAQAYIGEKFELTVEPKSGVFTLTPVKSPQQGWLEAFNAVADADADKMLLEETATDFDREEWTW